MGLRAPRLCEKHTDSRKVGRIVVRRRRKPDSYPEFNDHVRSWLVALLKGCVSSPNHILSVTRVHGGIDLEISIEVAQESRNIFTEDKFLSLQNIVSEMTGILAPVIYLAGNPHPSAREAIVYTRGRV